MYLEKSTEKYYILFISVWDESLSASWKGF